jgi:transposase
LLQWELGVSNVEVPAESDHEAQAAWTEKPHKCKHPGRQQLPAELQRREKVLACTPEQCTCRACGQQTTVIGYERSAQPDVEPARYFVLVTKRDKRLCPFCQHGGIATAPLATRIIDKGWASNRVVIDAVVAKYSDHRVPRTRRQLLAWSCERDEGRPLEAGDQGVCLQTTASCCR